MNDEQINDLKALVVPKKYAGAVCRGSVFLGSGCGHCERCTDSQRLFAAARPAITDLIAALEAEREKNEKLREALEQAQNNDAMRQKEGLAVAQQKLMDEGAKLPEETLPQRTSADIDEVIKQLRDKIQALNEK